MNAMNICYVLSTSETSGGANKSLLELLKNIDKKEFVPFVVLRRKGNIEEILNNLNIKYVIIPYVNAVTTGNRIKDLIKKIFIKRGLHRIKKYYINNKIDLVHNNSLPVLVGMEAALECRIPFICHIREDVEKGLRVEFLNKKKHFDIVNYADDIIIISNFIKNNYLQYVPEAKVLYDGLDVNQYYLKKNILDSERINISIYGNLDEQKDQMVAVKAMEKLQKLHIDKYVLNIIGNLNTKG